MDLVLLRLSALGDILRVMPAWANLHAAFPGTRFRAVVEDRHAFLLEPLPWLEPVIVKRRRLSNPFSALGELRRVAGLIRGGEASLDFHGILKAALIPKLASIPERWGDGVTKEFAGSLQTHPLAFHHQTRYDQALGLAEAFGRSRGVQGLGRFQAVLKGVDLPDPGAIWHEEAKPRIVLVPGASRRGAIKRWPLRHWMTLAAGLRGRFDLRWSLGPEEEDLRTWLPEATGIEALPRLGFWQLASALRQADRVVAPDTGLLHLAVVLGVPALGLYGSSDPVVAGLPAGAGRVLRTGIACAPCRERACQRRQCLEELLPTKVSAALLEGPAASGG
ncbi:MAG: glycosyltransferase family 9 protein [Geothrix sp.]|uniref:glycosyltransferase family 9 protein n=1 Tax=Geothrix sp. TaxID=1962974 RepID=UPI00179DEF2E|nr:glycosyltransferase family 9 protein [Geothrix sp.]NWJ40169.1 glycosyltransferase family 9 protein [Geothrix sp.]WIL21823.1 MAG: glycosyltransferase family 9 protein [Geothrix sp.]